MIFCRRCGVENPETMRDCGSCGAQLDIPPLSAGVQGTVTAPAAASVVAQGDMLAGGYHVASMRDRLVATVLDSTFLIAAFVLTGMVLAARMHGSAENGFALTSARAWRAFAGALAAGVLYFWLCEGLFGATLGKALAGIQVRTTAGGRCGLIPSLVRNLLRIVDGLGVYLFGFILALFSSRRQRLGDQVAGTIVVEHRLPRAARVALIAAWCELFAAGLAGAFLLNRSALVPEATAIRIGNTPPVPIPASSPAGRLHAVEVEFLEYAGGPPRPASPYEPGDTVYLQYDVGGYATGATRRPNLLLSAVASDPNGIPLQLPWTGTFDGLPDTGDSLRGAFSVKLPVFAPPGTYKIALHVYDQLNNADLELAPAFAVEAPAILPSRDLELRDFELSLSRDGPAVARPVLRGAGTVYMRSNLFGLQFRGDQVNARVALRVVSPSGKIVFDQPEYASINTSTVYHPTAFWLPVHGHLGVPSNLEKGTYTEQYTIVDNIAYRQIRRDAQFEVK